MSSTNTAGKQEAWNGASGSCCSSHPVPHANTPQQALLRHSLSCQLRTTDQEWQHSARLPTSAAAHPGPLLNIPPVLNNTTATTACNSHRAPDKHLPHGPNLWGHFGAEDKGPAERKPHRSVRISGVERKVCVCLMCCHLASQHAGERWNKKAELLFLLIL